MKYYIHIINKEGIFQEDDYVDELTELTIEQPIKNIYAVEGVTPKWDGGKWVEVVEKPEKEYTPPKPSEEERLEALELNELERLMNDD